MTTLPQNRTYGVFLQRLANPILPFNATTNPYVTVDYFKDINTGNGLYASFKYDAEWEQIVTANATYVLNLANYRSQATIRGECHETAESEPSQG